jgi:hypothetical protein
VSEIPVTADVRGYIEAIPAAHRPLFDRLHGLIHRARPDVTVVMSYKMPTYKAGGRRVLLAAWKHGISVYGWRKDDDGGFVATPSSRPARGRSSSGRTTPPRSATRNSSACSAAPWPADRATPVSRRSAARRRLCRLQPTL